MPCNSDHMAPTPVEKRASKLACFLGELDGKQWLPSWLDGTHPDVYCKNTGVDCDKMARELCERLQGQDVTRYSLELQIWWRDHQKADAARLAAEATEAERQAALAKLTRRDREVLGLLGKDIRTKP